MSQPASPPPVGGPPAALPHAPKGPSSNASPRAHEAFGRHLERELGEPSGRKPATGASVTAPRGAHVSNGHGPDLPAAPGTLPPAATSGQEAAIVPPVAAAPASAPVSAGTEAPALPVVVATVPPPAAPPAPMPVEGAAPPVPEVAAGEPAAPVVAVEVPQAPLAEAPAAPPASSAPPAVPGTPSADVPAVEAPVAAGATPPPAPTAPAGAPAPAGTPAEPAPVAAPPQSGEPPATAPPAGDAAAEQRRDKPARIPGPPPSAAAWQHASPPAHSSSALASAAPPVDAGQPAPSGPAATAPAAPPPAATPRPAVLLSHAAETVRLTIAAANQQGVSHARIALRPAELGGIEIMLAHGPAGLSATLTADSAQAAQALQRAADDLHRTLADQGLNLVRLDINVAADGRNAQAREDRGASADHHGAGRNGTASDRVGATDEAGEARTIELPNGVLVDVLA